MSQTKTAGKANLDKHWKTQNLPFVNELDLSSITSKQGDSKD